MSSSIISVLVLLLAMFGGMSAQAKPRVVATVGDLGAIAREVAGDAADVEVLAPSTQDPHYVDARPNLVLTLSRADLLVLIGMDLEIGWLPTLLTGSRNPKIQAGAPGYLDTSSLIAPLEVLTQKVDRSMGDVHPGGNPHFTKDPRRAIRIAHGVAERLGQIEPARASYFRERAAAFERALLARASEWEARLRPFAGAPIVTYHRSFSYLAEWTKLDVIAYVEPKPGLQPSSGHVALVLKTMREKNAHLVLQELWYPAATSERLAKLANAKLVRVPGMAAPGQSYGAHIEEVVTALERALTPPAGQPAR